LHLQSFGLATLWLLSVVPASAQLAIVQIRVISGDGAVHQPGARSLRPISVEITEETGKPVAGAAVSFHLPESGPGGLFFNGLRTEVVITDAQGHATLHGMLANRTPGRFQIRILVSQEQARAGTISFQYIAEPRGGAASASAGPANRKRWIAVAAVLTGGALAGVAASRGSTAKAATITAAASPAQVVTLAVSVGNPTITVGKP
jgi:hypothetical protein